MHAFGINRMPRRNSMDRDLDSVMKCLFLHGVSVGIADGTAVVGVVYFHTGRRDREEPGRILQKSPSN